MTFPAGLVKGTYPPNTTVRMGVVSAVSTGAGTTVLISGVPVLCGRLLSYTVNVSDVVAVLRFDSSWLILGEVTLS